jgi:hypothetical protein
MTILDLWYLIANSFKNFTGGKENVFAKAVAIITITKTLLAKAMSSLFGGIWTNDNPHMYYKQLYMYTLRPESSENISILFQVSDLCF